MAGLPEHYEEERPWGSFIRFTNNEPSTVKILHVLPGKRFSLQRHLKRSEYWRVIEGSGTLQVGDTIRDVAVGDEALIPVETLHRLTGGEHGIKVLEIALGDFDENDIERIEDDFGRIA